MENLDIRTRVYDEGLTYKRIAEKMQVHPVTLSRMMAKRLKPRERERIMEAISSLEAEEGQGA